jgi:enoyl-CoA hydratase/carnithine racemase
MVGMMMKEDRAALEKFIFSDMDMCFRSFLTCPKPIASAVNGHCIAGGMVRS